MTYSLIFFYPVDIDDNYRYLSTRWFLQAASLQHLEDTNLRIMVQEPEGLIMANPEWPTNQC